MKGEQENKKRPPNKTTSSRRRRQHLALIYTLLSRRRQDLSRQLSECAVYFSREESRGKKWSTGSSSSHTFMCQYILMARIFFPFLILYRAAEVCKPRANLAASECGLSSPSLGGWRRFDLRCARRAWTAGSGVVSALTQSTVDRTEGLLPVEKGKHNQTPRNCFLTGPASKICLYFLVLYRQELNIQSINIWIKVCARSTEKVILFSYP